MNTNLIAEVARTARLHTLNAEPAVRDFFAAASYHGVAKDEIAAVAELAACEYQNAAAPLSPRPLDERDAMKLRGKDRIEGVEVILVFKRGREVRVAKSEWIALAAANHEPHAIISNRR